jgi:hypothetical protein
MTHPLRDRIQRVLSLPLPPEKVWAEIGDFGSIAAWHPLVDQAEVFEIEGDTHRHLTLADGEPILERLVETGPLHYSYEVVESQLPIYDHRATLSCVAEDGGCHVFWSAMFERTDQAADDIVAAFYEEGLRALRERFGS